MALVGESGAQGGLDGACAPLQQGFCPVDAHCLEVAVRRDALGLDKGPAQGRVFSSFSMGDGSFRRDFSNRIAETRGNFLYDIVK